MLSREAAIAAVLDLYAVMNIHWPRSLFSAANGKYGFITNSHILIFWKTKDEYGLGNSMTRKAFDMIGNAMQSAMPGAPGVAGIDIPDFNRVMDLDWETCIRCDLEGCSDCGDHGTVMTVDGVYSPGHSHGFIALKATKGGAPTFQTPYLRLVSQLGIVQMIHLDSPTALISNPEQINDPANGSYFGRSSIDGDDAMFAILNPLHSRYPRAEHAVSEMESAATS